MELSFFQTNSGNEPVRDYLRALPKEERRFIGGWLRDIQRSGIDTAQVTTRHIEGKLWELKPDAHRIFYVLVSESGMVLLHAYKKQGQKAPRGEIETAKKRLNIVLEKDEP